MARRGVSGARKQEAAKQGALRQIGRGERPLYRVRTTADSRWSIEWTPWLSIDATTRSEAMQAARTAIAVWLEVEPDRFDVEVA